MISGRRNVAVGATRAVTTVELHDATRQRRIWLVFRLEITATVIAASAGVIVVVGTVARFSEAATRPHQLYRGE